MAYINKIIDVECNVKRYIIIFFKVNFYMLKQNLDATHASAPNKIGHRNQSINFSLVRNGSSSTALTE